MASVINTNIASLNSQRNLLTTQNALSTSIQRLSSGLRINSAKDDAAGLAISERFSSQIRGLNQATRNANDAISLTQTAEGAMSQISDNLQRVRELAVQSANATNSATDREAMQKEVTALLSEIDRVASQTDFNGTKLLDGSFSGQQMQVGANAGQTIGIKEILNAKKDSLGETTLSKDASIATLGKAGTGGATVTGLGVTVYDKDGTASSVALDDVKVADGQSYNQALAGAINSKLGQTGVIASVDKDDKLTISSIKEDQTFSFGALGADADATNYVAAATAADNGVALAVAVAKTTTEAKTVGSVSIDTVNGAQQAMSIIDNALDKVNSARADMGAIQNRFTSVIANLQSSTENLSASQSRIRDTDYASETAKLTRNQILQQAGTAMLAQANSLPNGVLSLLG